MRKLVLVHGRGQHDKNPKALEETWVNALKDGLRKNIIDFSAGKVQVQFPYYGDIINDLVEGEDEAITRGSDGGDDAEVEFRQLLMDEMAKARGLTDAQIRAESDDPTVSRDLLNAGWARAIMRAFDKYVPGVSGLAVEHFTRDVWTYLRRPGIRDQVDNVVRNTIGDGEECVVVGHSLGSVVAYGILKRDETRLKVPLFVTVGSPLAVGRIQDQFRPVGSPTCVQHWYNARDRRDYVALYLLAPRQFVVSPEVENYDKVDNFESNRHGIAGYLSDKDVAEHIWRGVTG